MRVVCPLSKSGSLDASNVNSSVRGIGVKVEGTMNPVLLVLVVLSLRVMGGKYRK